VTAVTGGSAADARAEVEALRRCISDVVALSTLSAMWAGASRATIATGLAQVLHDTLEADVVCVGLRAAASAVACQGVWPATPREDTIRDAICAAITGWCNRPDPDPKAVDLPPTTNPYVVTPIGISGEHGVIVTVVSRQHFPTDIHRLLLNLGANQATVALLAAKARDEERIADTLQRVGSALAAEFDLEKVVQAVTDEATAQTGANFGAFFYNVVNPAGESYMLYTLAGAAREAFSRFPMPRNTAIFGPTFDGSAVVRLPDVTADARFGHNPPYHGMPPGHLPVRSYLAVPIVSRRGKVHGGLFLGHRDVGVFTERHERLAIGLAAWAALAMDNGFLYADAQRANMAKDHFLATLSHELRTPLNAIVGWLSMLRRPEVMSAAGLPKAWAAIDRNTEALTGLIEDLLDLSRIATGKVRLAEGEVDINDVVRDSVRTMELKFEEKHVGLSVDLCPDPCLVRGDGARLRQVVVNLLSNAMKFTATGGQVRVAATCAEASAVVVVTDNGIGIHPDFLPHVFQPFRQGESNATTGLGLGLGIVKNLVELHGGRVTAESAGVGCGSRFTVTLPCIVSTS
jgi:signal transduction histidine kinase